MTNDFSLRTKIIILTIIMTPCFLFAIRGLWIGETFNNTINTNGTNTHKDFLKWFVEKFLKLPILQPPAIENSTMKTPLENSQHLDAETI